MGLLTPPEHLGGPTNPSRNFGWDSRPLPDLRVGLSNPPGPAVWPPDSCRTSGWA